MPQQITGPELGVVLSECERLAADFLHIEKRPNPEQGH